jgi:hypothetical protein
MLQEGMSECFLRNVLLEVRFEEIQIQPDSVSSDSQPRPHPPRQVTYHGPGFSEKYFSRYPTILSVSTLVLTLVSAGGDKTDGREPCTVGLPNEEATTGDILAACTGSHGSSTRPGVCAVVEGEAAHVGVMLGLGPVADAAESTSEGR